MNEQRKDLLDAIECCMSGNCEQCPLQLQICDELEIDTVCLPAALVDKIEEELASDK